MVYFDRVFIVKETVVFSYNILTESSSKHLLRHGHFTWLRSGDTGWRTGELLVDDLVQPADEDADEDQYISSNYSKTESLFPDRKSYVKIHIPRNQDTNPFKEPWCNWQLLFSWAFAQMMLK